MDKTVKISELVPNENNPRIIKDSKFKKLVDSIKGFPEMLSLRPIVVDEDMVILGGNMRYKASLEAGLDKIPIKIAKSFIAFIVRSVAFVIASALFKAVSAFFSSFALKSSISNFPLNNGWSFKNS